MEGLVVGVLEPKSIVILTVTGMGDNPRYNDSEPPNFSKLSFLELVFHLGNYIQSKVDGAQLEFDQNVSRLTVNKNKSHIFWRPSNNKNIHLGMMHFSEEKLSF